MHLSLKGSMDRQPLLDRLGDKLLPTYPGAAAAYSLQALNGNGDNVVRVRRESDNDERDFTALEVNSGELQNWVNSQIVPPLDIGVETSDGRPSVPDGGTSIGTPAAAYSLRSLGEGQADDIVPSGDTVTPAAGAYVVQVRRSSDDNVKSFTADELNDGTLEDWVNEIQTLGTVSNSVGNDGFTLTNASSTGFTATTETATGVCGWLFTAKSGDKITVSFDAVVRSGTPQFIPRKATALTSSNLVDVVSDTAIAVDSTGSYSFEFTYDSDEAGSLTFSEGDDYSDFDISNFQVTNFKGTGYVRTWYDQSTSDNHATQTTNASQPKIVDAGTYLGELDFDGVDDQLSTSSNIGIAGSQSRSIFTSLNPSSNTTKYFLSFGVNSAGQMWSLTPELGIRVNAGNEVYAISNTNVQLATNIFPDGSSDVTDSKMYSNGTEVSVTSSTSRAINTGGSILTIGFSPLSSTALYDGTISEIIIYDSDQSDNRTAIEANIGEHYGISGIPAYDNTVDGFVETWYDQSGGGNDAVQTVAANQPKIVDAGVFLGEIDFLDGTSTSLETDNSDLCNVSQLSVFTVLEPHRAASQVTAFSCGSVVEGSTGYGGWKLNLNGYAYAAVFQTQAKGNSSVTSLGSSVTAGDTLLSYVATFPNASAFTNGQAGATTTSAVSPDNNSEFRRRFRIGCQYTYQTASFYTQPIKEIIIYGSDQSANREAIEANINNRYNIYS